MQTVVDLCRRRLPDYYGFSPDQIQVLTPSRRQAAGTQQLNRMLQDALNPPDDAKPEKRYGDTIFRLGDRVMQVRNNYDIEVNRSDGGQEAGIFNGDIGIIEKISHKNKTLSIRFDERVAEYPFENLEELDFAYAVTTHKSQGSEFDIVVLSLAEGTPLLQYRNLLYTAVTRAKELLIIVGSENTVRKMVANNKQTNRFSGLRYLLEAI